jgi:predicted small secreted protein
MNPIKIIGTIWMRTLLLAIFAAGLAGCNTVQGIGKDLKDGGKAIEKAAADAR